MNEYYIMFFEDGAPHSIMERRVMLCDLNDLGYEYKVCRGACDWNHGMWLVMDDYPSAINVLRNHTDYMLRIGSDGEVWREYPDGGLEYAGRCVLRNRADALENGCWFTYDSLMFSIEEDPNNE